MNKPAEKMSKTGFRDLSPVQRRPLLMLGMAALVAGVVAGLSRLGWGINVPAYLPGLHGPLMVCGFFGTVIGLERAVATGRRPAYMAPAASGAGALSMLVGAPPWFGAALFTLAATVLLLTTVKMYRRQPELFTATLTLGAACFVIGNALWLSGEPVIRLVPWWAAFLILTIAGERLELSRFLAPRAHAKAQFAFILVAFIFTLALSHTAFGASGLALAILALVAWLLHHDVARRTVKGQGLPRFVAVSLLSGYAWLTTGAFVALMSGGMFSPSSYDATLHAVFLGFVFSMVFGHAPIIFPAVARLAVPYHPVFYVHLALLHISLALRLVGDLVAIPSLKVAGGYLNAVALAAFILNTVAAIVRHIRAERALSQHVPATRPES